SRSRLGARRLAHAHGDPQTHSLNMFILIALATGVAWAYSVVGTLFSRERRQAATRARPPPARDNHFQRRRRRRGRGGRHCRSHQELDAWSVALQASTVLLPWGSSRLVRSGVVQHRVDGLRDDARTTGEGGGAAGRSLRKVREIAAVQLPHQQKPLR